MILKTYTAAVKATAVTRLSDFVKNQFEEFYATWRYKKSAEKRDMLIDALKSNDTLRAEFREWFRAENDHTEIKLSEWEVDAEGEVVEAEVVDASAPAQITAPKVGAFVEGTFESLLADVAGLNAHDSHENLRVMEDEADLHDFRMGVLLNHINKQQHYVTLGHDSFREYVAATTGLIYRKCHYLMRNAEVIIELGISPEELKGVTWSALRHVAPILTQENYKEWLDMARSTTHAHLAAAVKEYNTHQKFLEAPKPVEKPKTMNKTFVLEEGQKLALDAALDAAKAQGNVDSNGAALELIVSSFTGKPPSDATVASVVPDTSDDGLRNVFTKMAHNEGMDAAVRILNLVSEVWPDLDISVEAPAAADVAAE